MRPGLVQLDVNQIERRDSAVAWELDGAIFRLQQSVTVVAVVQEFWMPFRVGLQNAMTSSRERTSAEAEGYRIHQ